MSLRTLTAYLATAALALSAVPLAAQSKEGPQGARPNPSGGSTGSAVSRPSGGGGAGDSGGSATSSSSGGGSSSSNNGGSASGGGFRSFDGARPARPEYRDRAVPRSSAPRGDDRAAARSGNERANPRGSEATVGSPNGRTSSAFSNDASGQRRAVPAYARPRDGRPTTGQAVERVTPPYWGAGYPPSIWTGPYNPWYGYGYYPAYGFGMGYFYDPWFWGSSYGYYDPYYWGGGGGGSVYRGSGHYAEYGSLRLKVKPHAAQVYVDGYFAGEIDSFDGVFQKLSVESGAHKIEIRAPGYETIQFEVMIAPGETVTYKGDLKRIQ